MRRKSESEGRVENGEHPGGETPEDVSCPKTAGCEESCRSLDSRTSVRVVARGRFVARDTEKFG